MATPSCDATSAESTPPGSKDAGASSIQTSGRPSCLRRTSTSTVPPVDWTTKSTRPSAPGATISSSTSDVTSPTVPCPHIPYSVVVEKNRTSMIPSANPVTKQVAGAPTSAAMCCIVSASSSEASTATPAGLPPDATSENAA